MDDSHGREECPDAPGARRGRVYDVCWTTQPVRPEGLLTEPPISGMIPDSSTPAREWREKTGPGRFRGAALRHWRPRTLSGPQRSMSCTPELHLDSLETSPPIW